MLTATLKTETKREVKIKTPAFRTSKTIEKFWFITDDFIVVCGPEFLIRYNKGQVFFETIIKEALDEGSPLSEKDGYARLENIIKLFAAIVPELV